MATIEERAKDFAVHGLPNNIEGAIRYTYIYAANEQQKIDIEKARWFLMDNCMGTTFTSYDLERLVKAMEEL